MYGDGTSKSNLADEKGGSALEAGSCTEKNGASQITDESERGYCISGLFRGDLPAKRNHQGSVSSARNSLAHAQWVLSWFTDSKQGYAQGSPENRTSPEDNHQSIVQVVMRPQRSP